MRPKPILFPVTYKCNLDCKYCYLKNSGPEPDLDKCLELIKNAEEEWIYLTGGEPLLVKNLEEICNKMKSYGKKIGITTNGTIKNYDIVNFTNRVGVSIDGNKEYHNIYRQNSFDQAVDFLKNMVGKTETVLMFTKFKENEDQVDYIEDLANTIGVDHLQITKGIV